MPVSYTHLDVYKRQLLQSGDPVRRGRKKQRDVRYEGAGRCGHRTGRVQEQEQEPETRGDGLRRQQQESQQGQEAVATVEENLVFATACLLYTSRCV